MADLDETLLLTDDAMRDHHAGAPHPERPERLEAVLRAIDDARIPSLARRRPRRVTKEELERVHGRAYVDSVLGLRGMRAELDPDTHMTEGSVEAALLAAGAAAEGVEAVLSGAARNAFLAVRPPGHHAERSRGMGFCIFNNVAVAAEHARMLGAERILIVDWDVHHGNGTQSHFYGRRDVLFFDAHRAPFYPGTGALHEVGRGQGEGYTVNAPMPGGLGDGDYRLLFEEVLVPIASKYAPDLILVSAGFDAHRDDPLGDQRVTEDGFALLTGIVRRLATDLCRGKLVMLMEGGYNVEALSRSVRACVEVLGGSTAPSAPSPSRAGEQVVRDVQGMAHRYFGGFR
jgi:acetoin utilization deacetylase AcuC-like enzyme